MISEYAPTWGSKNVVIWVDGTIRPWKTSKSYIGILPTISFDGQVFWLKEEV